MLTLSKSLKNHFLVSMPQIDDPNFHRSVVLLCAYDDKGAIGVIINHRSTQTFSEVCKQLDITYQDDHQDPIAIFDGGPVESELGLVLHSKDDRQWHSSIDVNPELQLTSSQDILVEIARGNGPQDALFVFGYSSWERTQLEQEIQDNVWFTAPMDKTLLFSPHAEAKWSMAANLLGVDINQFSSQVGHA